jgi:hypothetical protein
MIRNWKVFRVRFEVLVAAYYESQQLNGFAPLIFDETIFDVTTGETVKLRTALGFTIELNGLFL